MKTMEMTLPRKWGFCFREKKIGSAKTGVEGRCSLRDDFLEERTF